MKKADYEALKAESSQLLQENEQLDKQNKQLEKEIQQLKNQGVQAQAQQIAQTLLSEKWVERGLVSVVSVVAGLEGHQPLRTLSDSIRQKEKLSVIFLSDAQGNCVVSCDEQARKLGVAADALLKLAAEAAGGSGGGRPEMAQGRLKEPGKFGQVQQRLKSFLKDQVNKS